MMSIREKINLTLMVMIAALILLGCVWSQIRMALESDDSRKISLKQHWWENGVLYQLKLSNDSTEEGKYLDELLYKLASLDKGETGFIIQILTHETVSPNSRNESNIDFRIDPSVGTMEKFEYLIHIAHSLDQKLLVELNPNHASTDSVLFKNSEAMIPEYKDFFVWADGRRNPNNISEMLPPSNWINADGKSMWEWSDTRKQYYLHQFSENEPDFNLKNPTVRKYIKNLISFWLNMGVDGFKFNFVSYLFEADGEKYNHMFPDNPSNSSGVHTKNESCIMYLHTKNLDESFEIINEWSQHVADKRKNTNETKILIVEADASLKKVTKIFGASKEGVIVTPLNLGLIKNLSSGFLAKSFVSVVNQWLSNTPNGSLENWLITDTSNSLIARKYGTQTFDALNFLMLMLPGILIVNRGEDFGAKTFDMKESEILYASTEHYKLYKTLSKLRFIQPIKKEECIVKIIKNNTVVVTRSNAKESYTAVANLGETTEEHDIADTAPYDKYYILLENNFNSTGDLHVIEPGGYVLMVTFPK